MWRFIGFVLLLFAVVAAVFWYFGIGGFDQGSMKPPQDSPRNTVTTPLETAGKPGARQRGPAAGRTTPEAAGQAAFFDPVRIPGALLQPSEEQDEYVHYEKSVHGSFLVAAYKRPDFRVDVSLKGDTVIAGDPLNGVVTARYLFGPAMIGRPVTWSFSKTPAYGAPRAITEKFPLPRASRSVDARQRSAVMPE